MITDLDRLHKVISGEIVGRGCGTTFSKCHELAICATLKEFDYIVVIISDYLDINYLLPMIDKVFQDYDLKFSRVGNRRILCNGVRIDFIWAKELQESLRGCPDHYEVDMTRPMIYVKERDYFPRKIFNRDYLGKRTLEDESKKYNREFLVNYKW